MRLFRRCAPTGFSAEFVVFMAFVLLLATSSTLYLHEGLRKAYLGKKPLKRLINYTAFFTSILSVVYRFYVNRRLEASVEEHLLLSHNMATMRDLFEAYKQAMNLGPFESMKMFKYFEQLILPIESAILEKAGLAQKDDPFCFNEGLAEAVAEATCVTLIEKLGKDVGWREDGLFNQLTGRIKLSARDAQNIVDDIPEALLDEIFEAAKEENQLVFSP